VLRTHTCFLSLAHPWRPTPLPSHTLVAHYDEQRRPETTWHLPRRATRIIRLRPSWPPDSRRGVGASPSDEPGGRAVGLRDIFDLIAQVLKAPKARALANYATPRRFRAQEPPDAELARPQYQQHPTGFHVVARRARSRLQGHAHMARHRGVT